MYQAARGQLFRLDLLSERYHFRHMRTNETPEFDPATGRPKASGYELTPLGRMVLRYAGLAEAGEF